MTDEAKGREDVCPELVVFEDARWVCILPSGHDVGPDSRDHDYRPAPAPAGAAADGPDDHGLAVDYDHAAEKAGDGAVEALASLIADGVVEYFERCDFAGAVAWTQEVRDEEHRIAKGGQARASALRILASDWLAEHVEQQAREREAKALRDAYEELGDWRTLPDVSDDAVEAVMLWLSERAARIESAQRPEGGEDR